MKNIELPLIDERVVATKTSEFFEEFNERYEMKIDYYEESQSILVRMSRIATLGLLNLFELWFMTLRLWSFQATTQPSHLLIKKMKNGKRMRSDQLVKCTSDGERIKFQYEYINYVITWQNTLQKLEFLGYDYQQLGKYEAQQRQALYGENIMQIEERTRGEILLNEILSPFNVFQVFSFIVWSLDDYYLYAILIAALTILQIGISLRDLEQQNHKIREMIYFETNVMVHRDSAKWKISSKDLVPGDIVVVSANQMITFDGLLLTGEAVFNESIITGESTPILKTGDMQIFSGCTCLQASENCVAMVQQIGFNTVKGSLARYILFNNSYQYSFQKESLKYLIVLGVLGMILSVINYFIRIQVQGNFESVVEALEIFTIMIPPSLPTALGAGLQVAVQRLKSHSIYCIKPDKINVSGMVDMIGFDKTGTLTESTLSVLGCVEYKQLVDPNVCDETMQLALKSCHSLVGGCGDSLEIAMMECCKVKFNFECLRVYQFEAHLQRMTVIIRYRDQMLAITKGSPEIMERLCFKTLPASYQQVVKAYSQEGYRLITFGYKNIANVDEERKYIENGLQYLGILVFVNNIREDAKELISYLNNNNIKVCMVTGDNVLTSINVAKQCSIFDPHKPVIVGEMKDGQCPRNRVNGLLGGIVWRGMGSSQQSISFLLFLSILDKTKVFARMKPSQKGNLMLKLKSLQPIFTAFCGDGCNDICALQQSDIGLALSNQEASLAAPFLTPIMKPSQIIEILKAGRCALITSQQCFKFMTLYSSIQTIALTLCYLSHTNFTVQQFLYQDLWIIIPLAFAMGLTKQATHLSINKPFVSLLSKSIIQSIIGLFVICTISQVISYWGYDDTQVTIENAESANPINTQQIILANTQVIAVSIAYSQGKPFREPLYRNYYLVLVLLIATGVHILLIILPKMVGIDILIGLTSEQIVRVFIINGVVFIIILLYENIFVKQYHY